MGDTNFRFPINLTEIAIPAVGSGVLLAGALFFLYIYINRKKKSDLSVALLSITGFVYSFLEILVVYIGGIDKNFALSVEFFRVQHIFATLFILSFPIYLLYGFGVKGNLIKVQKIFLVGILIFTVVTITAAFLKPDLFVSLTISRNDVAGNILQSDLGRGKSGILYRIRDLLLIIVMINIYYSLIVTLIRDRSKRTIIVIFGICTLLWCGVEDLMMVNFHKYIVLSHISYSRVALGMTLFIISAMALAAYDFLADSFKIAENEAMLKKASERDQELIVYINKSTGKINSAMNEVFEGNKQLSEYTENQASRLENISASIKEISDTMKMTADVIGKASAASVNSQSVIENGVNKISSMVSQIGDISAASNKILDITKIISSIAFQTNILALNAAVEAARAGEQGRGFAVVASEVRNLAQTTSASASDVGRLIDEVVSKISIMHKEAEVSRDILEEIKNISVDDTEALIKMNDTIKDQYGHIEVINGEIEEVSNLVQENTRLAENVSERSHETSKEAHDLANVVNAFENE